MLYKECYEEQIHRCGQIQHFGFLFVFDQEGCISASENIEDVLGRPLSSVLGRPMAEVLGWLSDTVTWDLEQIEAQITGDIYLRYVERVRIREVDYYVSIYRHDGRTYVEVEVCNESHLKATKLFYYARYLEERHESSWQSLAVLIREIIRFDRVMVYRFEEDSSGQVIAESTAEGMSSLLGYRYPEFDIPAQARALYTTFLARHVADINAPVIALQGTSPEEIDLTRCSLRALSPVHLQYLKNAGARASASFSIIVEGKLWGLVACQNRSPLNVDLAQRHLCVFLTQYAVNFYLSQVQKKNLGTQSALGALESDLKTELMINHNAPMVLERFAEQIMAAMRADGMLIRHDRGQRSWGEVPGQADQNSIDALLNGNEHKETFVSSDLVYETEQGTTTLFPGVIRIKILSGNKWYLYLFRKEQVYEEVWAGKPEKIISFDEERQISYPSPRTSFEAWRAIMNGQSVKWKEAEIDCIERIVHVIQQAVAQRGGEIEQLNKELVRANNALETFSYTLTHDLKNPLSAIKLAGQIIHQKEELPQEMLRSLSKNILDAAGMINDMLDKVYELNQSSRVALKTELIDPREKIVSIFESCKQQYGVSKVDFHLGPTYPVQAERTLLYQLFLNLVGNAVKYSSQEESPRVEVFSEQLEDAVVYYIKDNGIGMDLQDGNNIFDIFKRLPNTEGFEGSGIGLSIVKRITDRLGAKIDVASQLQVGTTFSVSFGNTAK